MTQEFRRPSRCQKSTNTNSSTSDYPMINIARLVVLIGIIFTTSVQFSLSASADDTQQNLANDDGKSQTKVPLETKEEKAEQQSWLLHTQGTEIFQGQPGFHDPYDGVNSLRSTDNFRQTSSLDLFFGARFWPGSEFYFNPEYFQGFGLGLTHGIAAFPNAQAYKVGKYRGDLFIPHLFLRQVWGLGGEQEQIDGDLLQLAGKADISRVTLTVGKMGVGDQFDNNAYAHDPTTQFLNWVLVDQGSFDYAADSLGYEYGATLELNQKRWAVRWGIFTVPRVSNGLATDGHYAKAWQQVAELEERYELCGHPGKIRFLGYLESAKMGSYRATLNNPSLGNDITQTRRYRYTYGLGINIEQEITKDIGAFLRAGYRDPNYEIWQFTDVTRSLSLGLQIKGSAWCRPNDTFGLADALDGVGHAQRRFFAAGGLGPLVGDGKLPHYGLENVIETYYNFEVFKGVNLSLDYQLVINPAYNQDRGPINVFAARIHFQY
jgi:high affinity Mn2+ porin